MLRGLLGLALAACIGAAAFASQSSYGEAARLTLAQWAPNLISTSPLWLAKPANSAQPGSSTVQLAAAEATPVQATASAQATAQDVAPTSAPLSSELTQLLQTMARDIAAVEQGIEQLKASQQQLVAMISENVSAASGLFAEANTTAVLPVRITGATRETIANMRR